MTVLGIDPGSDCGWALYDGANYLSGTWHLKPKGSLACGDHGLLYLRRYIRDTVMAVGKLDLIVFETPIGYAGSIGRTVSALSAGNLKCGVIVACADDHGCHWLGITPTEVKGFAKSHQEVRECFEKRGAANKDEMFNAAKMYFHKVPQSFDETDALWICAYGVEKYEGSIKQPCAVEMDLTERLKASIKMVEESKACRTR